MKLDTSIEQAVKILKNGGVVIFPTDTVYGIGCRFDDQKAIDRIYQIKGTPKNQPFPILVASLPQVEKLAIVTQTARNLIKKYWPGALTIILPGSSTYSYSNPGLEQLYKPGLKGLKIGFRMPDSNLMQSLIKKVGVPIVGTSANFHGAKTPKSYKDLDTEFIKSVDFVLKGKCTLGIESTVIDATSDPAKILRKGAISLR